MRLMRVYEAFPMAHVDHKSGNYREEGQLSAEDLGLIRKLTRADRKVGWLKLTWTQGALLNGSQFADYVMPRNAFSQNVSIHITE